MLNEDYKEMLQSLVEEKVERQKKDLALVLRM